MRSTAFVIVFLSAATSLSAEPKIAQVRKIWDQAPHNAFTDLIRFQDKWYCSFREGPGHAAGAGTIRVLASDDGEKWTSAASLEVKDEDLRDPKLSLASDGRLMLVGASAVPATRNPVKDHYSFVCFSKDGKEWSKPQRVLESWQWLWRVTWHKGTAYGVAYQWDPKADKDDKKRKAFLAKSGDGVKWEKVVDFTLANPSEATLIFDGDDLYCLQRRDGRPNTAQLGHCKAPFTDWTWKDLGMFLGGPNFIRLPDGTWIAAGRTFDKGKPQTALARLDLKEGKLTPVLTLPSGGDTSYPGLVWKDGKLWVSYYSSHEGKTSIYLARVEP